MFQVLYTQGLEGTDKSNEILQITQTFALSNTQWTPFICKVDNVSGLLVDRNNSSGWTSADRKGEIEQEPYLNVLAQLCHAV